MFDHDLPTEILTKIVSLCDNLAISETCKTLAAIAHSIPSLWTTIILRRRQFTIDGPDFLRARILRTKGAMLTVHIGPVTEHTKEVSALCKLLAEYNAQIRRFYLTARTTILAGGVVYDGVFPNVEVFQALQVLSILVWRPSDHPWRSEWPRLDVVLVDATTKFPNLQELYMNSFEDCVPLFPLSASFSHLSTLVLNGSREDEVPYPMIIVALLNCTPQLESLWIKHLCWENPYNITGTATGTVGGRQASEISLDIRLPRLRHLAVSVPVIACDLLGFITAPMVEDLHLDGSREPEFKNGKRLDFEWEEENTTTSRKALRTFAFRCQNVRRLAVTEAYLSRNVWDWIMFGEDGGDRRFQCCSALRCMGYSMPCGVVSMTSYWRSLRMNRVYRSRGLLC